MIDGEPLNEMAPRAVIASPTDGSTIVAGPAVIRGYAWSGRTTVDRVEVSVDGGATWSEATLRAPSRGRRSCSPVRRSRG